MPAEQNPYRYRIPRAHRKVMLVLLSDAANLGPVTIARAAGTGSASTAVVLAHLERLGWVITDSERPVPGNRPPRVFYRLTFEGRARVMALLGLAPRVPEW